MKKTKKEIEVTKYSSTSYTQTSIDIDVLLYDIRRGAIQILDIQRDYEWSKKHVVKYIKTLIRGNFPGSLGFLEYSPEIEMGYHPFPGLTPEEGVQIKYLVIDGLQRLLTLLALKTGWEIPHLGPKGQISYNYVLRLKYNPMTNVFDNATVNWLGAHNKKNKDTEWITDFSSLWGGTPEDRVNMIDEIKEEYISRNSIILKKDIDLKRKVRNNISKVCNVLTVTHPVTVFDENTAPDDVFYIFNTLNSAGVKAKKLALVNGALTLNWGELKPKIAKSLDTMKEIYPNAPKFSDLNIVTILLGMSFRDLRTKDDTIDKFYNDDSRHKKENFDRMKNVADQFFKENHLKELISVYKSAGYIDPNRILIPEPFDVLVAASLHGIGRFFYNINYSLLNSLIRKFFFVEAMLPRLSVGTASNKAIPLLQAIHLDLQDTKKTKAEHKQYFIDHITNAIDIGVRVNTNSLAYNIFNCRYKGKKSYTNVFLCSQVVNNAKVLFSEDKVIGMSLPELANHHFIPKELAGVNDFFKSGDKEDLLNRVCNVGKITGHVNNEINNALPSAYWLPYTRDCSKSELEQIMYDYCLPADWYNITNENEFINFMENRSELMADYIVNTIKGI